MSDNHDDSDDDFGQKLPPLHIYLKRVLDKYPEGGQILKELVQNADDAGARRVVILYDKTQHPTDSMWSDSLRDFNGPSLYVYNDATFQAPDWKNIQHPEQSGKMDDPTKVGRFGLGFISIYHLTDVPSVLSGNQIGFLDPHERYFVFDPHERVKHKGKRGKKWRISADILDRFPDQFDPYLEPLFNCSRTSFENGHFDGTIFRFPLRNSKIESQVSSAVYDDERVQSLFQSYRADAEISLLFLKNVESVALYEKTNATEAPKLLFSVEISEANRQQLRSEREQFLAGVTQPADAKAVCRMGINKQMQFNHHGITTSCNKYLTINIVKKEGISHQLQDLAADKDLKLLPWVGVSMLVDGHEKDRGSGRVFCFLPLPESERTGLPIHVHGYFGLGDNRRSIKWPDRESTYDKAARWNQLLVHEVFPDAYQTLIINAISDGLSADDVYRSWPDVSTLYGEWKEGVKTFLGKIKNESVLFTNTEGGVWKKPVDMLIHPQNDELIQSILEKKGMPVARVPDNVRRSLEWGGIQTKVVTPAIVRRAIRGDSLAWMNREDKLHLLRYILEDNQFGDLQQIFLLPLADESFTSFSSSNSPVYISTNEIPRDLFPNMSSRFVAEDVPQELHKAVGYTQLKQLTCSMVPSVLKEALPRDWIQGSSLVNWTPGSYQQPDMNWLERIWCWLTRNASSVSLSNLSVISLIPLDESGSNRRLARINIHQLILRQQISGPYGQRGALPESMCSYLETLGAIVLRNDIPCWMAEHPQVNTIIKSPDINGFTSVLDSCWSSKAVQNIDTGGDGLRSDIRSFFKHATLSDRCKVLLRQLPVFNTTDMAHSAVAHVKVTVPQRFHGIPVQRLRQRFLLEKDESDGLAFKLGARRISENELLCTYILPDVGSKYYNSNDTTKIMLWVLERPQYDCTVRNLSFVTTKEGVCRPTELFAPDDPRLKLLFKVKHVFPTGVYATGRPLHCLKRVGMRGLSSVTAQEMLEVANDVSQSGDREVARALLDHITDNPHLLAESVNFNRIRKPLGKFLCDRAWVPCETNRPRNYPDTLCWHGNHNALCRPDELALFDDSAYVLGSVMPLVEVQIMRSEFRSYFDWDSINPNKYPTVEQVILHLKNASSSSQDIRYVQTMAIIVDAVYKFLNQTPARFIQSMICDANDPLVWHGSGFTTADKIAFSSGTISVNLAPYFHILPTALTQYRGFLETIGVKEQFTSDVLNQVLNIIQNKHQKNDISAPEYLADLKLVCDILNSIIRFASPDSSLSDVLVPCRKGQGDLEHVLKMACASECLYVDEERLLEEYYHSDCKLPVVHEMIPNQTAKRLGLRPLSHSVAPVENVDLGYDVEGPHQTTVNAIKRNLDMYKEGLDIFKELIQNADDAGAKEVKFLIDWRDNSGNASSLMSEGMQMCHGPALWAYNDATFNENDVKNICSIAAASKKDQLDKIGRFGLGFTSVYHITDVPSLVSGPFVLIFDPRTNHLGSRINPGQPGIQLDLRNESHRRTLRSYPNQFQPFQGVFNCDLSPSSKGFDKTLFRLPLRTQREASDMSEDYLSKAVYNSQEEMTKMVMALKTSAPSLLLFTQNVTHVSINTLGPDCTISSDIRTLLNISVDTIKTLPRCIASQDNIPAQRKILQATQTWMKTKSLPVPETTAVVKVTTSFMATKKSGQKVQKTKEHVFVVSSCMETGRALQMAESSEGRKAGVLPCGGVAVQLGNGKERRVPIAFDNEVTLGGAFSYLPLDVCTGLPFHVNGNFLLQPNRRHLWGKSSSASKVKQGGEFETRWNVCFMEYVICKALVNVLEDLQFLQMEDFLDATEFQLLWPKMMQSESDFHSVVQAFYKCICNSDCSQTPKLIYNGNRWVSIHDCFFMEGAICSQPVGDAVRSILNQRLHPRKSVTLQEEVLQSVAQIGISDCLKSKTYDLGRFLREVYFPMIKNGEDVPRMQQKNIMLHLLDLRIGTEKRIEFDEELRTLECFPASPDGEELASPEQLIHPDKAIGQLFKEADGRFPYGKDYRREERLLSLSELGMATDKLQWGDIIDRAESFTADDSRQKQIEKCIILLRLIDTQLRDCEDPSTSQKNRLQNARFLPVLAKPCDYPMDWYESCSQFMASSELFEEKHKYLLGSMHPLFDEKCLGVDGPSHRVKSLLGIGGRLPEVDDVVKQLRAVVTQVKPVLANNICHDIYGFFNNHVIENDKIDDNTDSSILPSWTEELKSIAFVLVDGKFVRCNQLAFECNRRGGQYLYAVPLALVQHKPLLSACGVKESFTFYDYVKVVETLKHNHKNEPLPDTDAAIAEEMLKAMVSLAETEDSRKERVLALDYRNVLRLISELTYNDMSWLDLNTVNEEINFTHKSITAFEAEVLEIRTLRQIHLSNCSSKQGFQSQFGQKEDLTTRLKGILREYSHKADVLKELLQNADDAGATEIHIVYDPRKHDTTKIVGPSWKAMHNSPAICVYNNKPFTDADIEGIQNVGVGGKTSDAATTGRFGIGFNSVYHLTDCPTFVTHSQQLCVFDPHVTHIPGATDVNPGMLYSLQGSNGCLATFPDMVDGYLGEFDEFDLEKGTMFRFPLRTSPNSSNISPDTYLSSDVKKLFQEFEHVARESLLFLNSVQKISISEVDVATNSLKSQFWITAQVSDDAMRCRNDLRYLSKKFQATSDVSVSEVAQQNWVYEMTVEDSLEKLETWLISQTFGVDEMDKEQEGAFQFKVKGYLPRGGVAALLRVRQAIKDDNPFERRYKAFTCLPLQVYTCLPVHVNGTFELDQSRRNLVKGEDYGSNGNSGKGLIHKWNKLLAEHVIGPAYAKLIYAAGRILLDPTQESFKNVIQMKHMLYDRLFPTDQKHLSGEWELVARSMLLYIGNNSLDVLPVINATGTHVKVSWHHPVSDNSRAFFDNLSAQLPEKESTLSTTSSSVESRSDTLKKFLVEIGFHLISSNWTICQCFVDAGVKARLVSPDAVSKYLAHIEHIADTYPCHITNSKFRHTRTVCLVLEYCLMGAKQPADLNGLPLRLTNDDILGQFSFTNTVYVTQHSDILPNIPELFLHRDLVFLLRTWFSHDDREQLCYFSGMFKEFTLGELEIHLHKLLPSEWRECSQHTSWTPGINKHPTAEWLKGLWNFISYRCQLSDGREFDALSEWAIYPTTCGKIVSPNLSKTILFLDKFSDSSSRQSLKCILQKVGCTSLSTLRMGLESDDLSGMLLQILESRLAVATKQSNVLTVIRYMMDVEHVTMEGKLDSAECDELLRYFQDGCEAGNGLPDDDIQTLKRLPIFPAANGDRISTICTASNCHTVSSCDLPDIEIDSILSSVGCVLLRSSSILELLYKKLNITPINTAGIFLKYILPNFETVDDKTKLSYIEHIRDKVIPKASKEEQKSLYSMLKLIPFIQDVQGRTHTTDHYYDPTNEVFKCMIETINLVPKYFTSDSWRKFLEHIGLKSEVTTDMFVGFSKQIADMATQIKTGKEYKYRAQQSHTLVNQLDSNELLWDSSFLRQIADIKFIPSIKIEKELREIHPPYSSDKRYCSFEPFISYRGAVPARYKELAWSVAMILPSWAIPNTEYVRTDSRCRVIERVKVHECLGIKNYVILEKVLQHIQRVCDHFAEKNAVHKIDNVSRPVREKLMNVITKMMKHLLMKLSGHSTDIKRCLSFTPICPVEEGKILVRANKLVFNIDETAAKRLRPYLFQAPRDLSDFDDVLRTLGAESQVTFDQLAGVLSAIKESCDSCEDKRHERMLPNERRAAHCAVKQMFSLLKETEGICPLSVTELFLPTSEDKLKLSTDLYYADVQQMDRIAVTSLDFVVPLKQCDIETEPSESHLMSLLPTNLRPHNLKDKMKEKPCETNEVCPAEDDCSFIVHFKQIITSEEMQRVLLRLLQHQNQNRKLSAEQEGMIERLLSFDNFQCVVKLKTGLYGSNGNLLVERKFSRDVFLEKVTQNGTGFKLLLEHQDSQRYRKTLFSPLAYKIDMICSLGLDDKHLSYLREVVECRNVGDMNEQLTRMDIPEYDNVDNKHRPDPAKPGTIVPEDIRHLLDDDPYNLFQPDEIVVYKSSVEDSDSKTVDNTEAATNVDSTAEGNNDEQDVEEYSFVYARLIEEATDKGTSHLKRRYRIDVGESNPIVVSVLSLYKFRRPRKPTDTTFAVFTGDPDSATEPPEHRVPPPRDLKDAKNRIREAVREVFTLPENEQKEALHRLYKSWHPDKNAPEESHLCNEAFKFLKELLASKGKEEQGGSSTCSRDYASRYESWESDIQRQREQERAYQERYRDEFSSSHRGSGRRRQRGQPTSGSSYVPPSFSDDTPDPQNARKWYRQAEEELCKTQEQYHSDLKAPWRSAFYLHQVVEIALKAAKFYQDGKPNKSSTDLVSLVIDLSGARSNDLVSKVRELIRLDVDFHKPRYPDSVNNSSSMQRYADFDEAKGLQICTEILHIVRDMIGIENKSRASGSNNSHKQRQSNIPKKDEENQSNIFGQDKEHQSIGPEQGEEHQTARPKKDEEHQSTKPGKNEQHQSTMAGQDEKYQSARPEQDEDHQSIKPGQNEQHQSTMAGQDEKHQSARPEQDEDHQSTKPGQNEQHQSTMAGQDGKHQSARPEQDEDHQSTKPGQNEQHHSTMAGQDEKHQSARPEQDEDHQNTGPEQHEYHQSTRSGQDEENQPADEEHQSSRPRQDKKHQPTIPEKKHSGYTNVPDELPSLSSLSTRTRTQIKIGSSGGTINLLGNTVQLKIPEGALQSEVEIELSVLSPKEMCPPLGDKQFVIAPIIQCKPEGLQFRKPVKLTVPHCGVNVSAKHIQIWRKDKDETGWGKDFDGAQNEEKESVKVESKRIRMRIRHFTWYATVLNFVTNFFRGSPHIELNLLVFRSNLRDSKSMLMRFYAVQDYQIESVEKEEAEEEFTKRGFRKRRIDVQPNGNDLQIKVMDVRDLQGEDVWEPSEAMQVISCRGLNRGGVDASCTFKFTKKEDTVNGVQGIWIAEQEDNDSEFKEENFCVDLEISPSPSDSRRRSLRTIPAVGGADGGGTLSNPGNVRPNITLYNPTFVRGNNTPVSGNQENYGQPTNKPSSRSLPVEAAPDTPAIEDHD